MTADKALEAIREALSVGEGPLRAAINTITPAASSHRGLKQLRKTLDEVFAAYDEAEAKKKKPAKETAKT